jgi:nicotinate-nucleotide adenylyltransferase
MKTGIFGGTFDPIHIGHLIIADTVRSDFPLDRILFIPTGIPPHKASSRISSGDIRLEMVKMAIASFAEFEWTDCEVKCQEVSYTIDTIQRIRETDQWGNDDLYFIIGADSLVDIETWKNPKAILEAIPTIVVGRPGIEVQQTAQQFLSKVTFIETPLIEVSSTLIRQRIRAGQSIRSWVPREVEAYIHKKGLYL